MPERDTEQSKEKKIEKHIETGVGADLFIRKNIPGSHIGKGYTVEIYENGIKQDEVIFDTKKDVSELIRKYKEKYRTDRAFQNESQVHVTFRTKEERGELPAKTQPMVPSTKEEESMPPMPAVQPIKETIKSPKTKSERGEQLMASIDNLLIKQAGQIQDLLTRIIDPEMPVKVRIGEEVALDPTVTSIPETPPPSGEETFEDKEQVKNHLVKEILTKIVGFISEKYKTASYRHAQEGESESQNLDIKMDDFYNPIKSWYGALARAIENWNKLSNGAFTQQDVADITEKTEDVLLSGDPNMIQEATGIQIDEQIALIIKDVCLMEIGTKKEVEEGGELGGNPEESKKEEELPKVALNIINNNKIGEELEKTTSDKLNEFTNLIQKRSNSMAIEEVAKEIGIDNDITMLTEMFGLLDKKAGLNESESAAIKWIESKVGSKRLEEAKKINFVTSVTNEFWKYASDLKGEFTLEDVFINWLEERRAAIGIQELEEVWKHIYADIRTAIVDDPPVTTLNISLRDQQNQPAGMLYESEIVVDIQGMRGKILIDQTTNSSTDKAYNVSKEINNYLTQLSSNADVVPLLQAYDSEQGPSSELRSIVESYLTQAFQSGLKSLSISLESAIYDALQRKASYADIRIGEQSVVSVDRNLQIA